jgi:hypothetical protein
MSNVIQNRAKSSKINRTYRKKSNFVPPTCTTFNNFGTIRNKVGNVAGFTDENLISTGHKKPFATFGLPKGKLLTENHRDLCLTRQPQFPKEKIKTKEPLP